MGVKVKFTKIGNRIKYELPFVMVCRREPNSGELGRTWTLDKTDSLFSVWLGDVDKAFKNRKSIIRKVYLGQIFDCCDSGKLPSYK